MSVVVINILHVLQCTICKPNSAKLMVIIFSLSSFDVVRSAGSQYCPLRSKIVGSLVQKFSSTFVVPVQYVSGCNKKSVPKKMSVNCFINMLELYLSFQMFGSPKILPLKRDKSGGPWLQIVTRVVPGFVTLESCVNLTN